jgi:hypothetical protein
VVNGVHLHLYNHPEVGFKVLVYHRRQVDLEAQLTLHRIRQQFSLIEVRKLIRKKSKIHSKMQFKLLMNQLQLLVRTPWPQHKINGYLKEVLVSHRVNLQSHIDLDQDPSRTNRLDMKSYKKMLSSVSLITTNVEGIHLTQDLDYLTTFKDNLLQILTRVDSWLNHLDLL